MEPFLIDTLSLSPFLSSFGFLRLIEFYNIYIRHSWQSLQLLFLSFVFQITFQTFDSRNRSKLTLETGRREHSFSTVGRHFQTKIKKNPCPCLYGSVFVCYNSIFLITPFLYNYANVLGSNLLHTRLCNWKNVCPLLFLWALYMLW